MGWPKGRPRTPIERRPVPQSVRLSPETADLVCRMALKRGVSVYAFLGGILERVFEKQKSLQASQSCYGQQSSTISNVLSSDRGAASPR